MILPQTSKTLYIYLFTTPLLTFNIAVLQLLKGPGKIFRYFSSFRTKQCRAKRLRREKGQAATVKMGLLKWRNDSALPKICALSLSAISEIPGSTNSTRHHQSKMTCRFSIEHSFILPLYKQQSPFLDNRKGA